MWFGFGHGGEGAGGGGASELHGEVGQLRAHGQVALGAGFGFGRGGGLGWGQGFVAFGVLTRWGRGFVMGNASLTHPTVVGLGCPILASLG